MVHFSDNIFTYSKSRTLDLCSRIKKQGLGLAYSCDTRAGLIDGEMVKAMEEAGFCRIAVGFEDASRDVLMKVNKEATLEQNIRTAELIRANSDMCVVAYWLTGLPGSSPASLAKNTRVIRELLGDGVVDLVSLRMFVPYPGTPIFCDGRGYGLEMVNNDWSVYDRTDSLPVFRLDGLSRYEIYTHYLGLRAMINEMYRHKLGLSSAKMEDIIATVRAF
jgi:radical SAM superfamily enzyme YgiQ (UPF0313 family)